MGLLTSGIGILMLPTPAVADAPDTAAPDLVSATLMPGNQVNVQQDVEFCFRGATAAQPNGDTLDTIDNNFFYVRTYDSGLFIIADSVEKSQSDGKCVIAHFPPGIDLSVEGSVGEVDASPGSPAVTGINTKPNYYSSVPLTGSQLHQVEGRTTGPDLVAVTQGSTSQRVRFVFDQTIDTTTPIAASFYAVNGEGTRINGSSTPTIGDANVTDPTGTYSLKNNMVVVEFASNVADLNRYGVDVDAVRTPVVDGPLGFFQPTNYTSAPPAVVVKAASGRPELQSAVPASGGQFRLTYNANVQNVDATKIFAVFDNGVAVAPANATDWSATADAKQILVKFGNTPVADQPSAVVKVVSDKDAVFSNDTIPRPAFASDVPVGAGAPFAPGATTGPDLLSVQASEADRQVTFSFDEEVDPTLLDETRFTVVAADGTIYPGSQASASGSDVVVDFALSEVQAAVAVSVQYAAIFDPLGQPNVNGSLAITPPVPPTAQADNVTVNKGASANVSPLANDTFSGAATLTLDTSGLASGLTATVNPDNTVKIEVSDTYAGGASATVPYTVTDENGSATSQINVTIRGVDTATPPVVVDDAVTVERGSSALVDVLANDTVTGEPTVTLSGVPQGMSAVVTAEDKVFVSVGSDFSGSSAALSYSVTDDGGTTSGVLTVTVPTPAEVETFLSAKVSKKAIKGQVIADEGCDAGRSITLKMGKKKLAKTTSKDSGAYKVKITKKIRKKAKGKKVQLVVAKGTSGAATCLVAKSSKLKLK